MGAEASRHEEYFYIRAYLLACCVESLEIQTGRNGDVCDMAWREN